MLNFLLLYAYMIQSTIKLSSKTRWLVFWYPKIHENITRPKSNYFYLYSSQFWIHSKHIWAFEDHIPRRSCLPKMLLIANPAVLGQDSLPSRMCFWGGSFTSQLFPTNYELIKVKIQPFKKYQEVNLTG